jgi:CRP/FNR family transcriptional regulator
VKIFRGPAEDPDEQEEVAVLNNNALFGEMALVSDKPRNASAKTIEDSEIFRLKKDDFYNLVTNNPSIAEQISSEFISRVKENMRKRSTS